MKLLISEGDDVSRRLLEPTLKKWGYRVMVAKDGREAFTALRGPDPPALAILDWMMPEMDGLEVTRAAQSKPLTLTNPYIILLTAGNEKQDIVKALEAGADDYLTKPIDPGELRSRVQVALRIVELQRQLLARVRDLDEALATVKQLQGMLPICSYCKRIRDDQNYWQNVESYITTHSAAQFSHGICPDCYQTNIQPQLDDMRKQRQPNGAARREIEHPVAG